MIWTLPDESKSTFSVLSPVINTMVVAGISSGGKLADNPGCFL